MSFESGLTRFWAPLFRFTDPSQKRPFLRGDSGNANMLNFAAELYFADRHALSYWDSPGDLHFAFFRAKIHTSAGSWGERG
jgi:hypothetical protein